MSIACNVLIIGKTGTGKSSFANYLFDVDKFTTGSGEPVTSWAENFQAYHFEKKGIKINVYDSVGLEPDNQTKWMGELDKFLVQKQSKKDPNEIIHLLFYIINASSARIELGEIDKIKEIKEKYDIDGVVVLTHCDVADNDTLCQLEKTCEQNNLKSIKICSISRKTRAGVQSQKCGKDEAVKILLSSSYDKVGRELSIATYDSVIGYMEQIRKRLRDKISLLDFDLFKSNKDKFRQKLLAAIKPILEDIQNEKIIPQNYISYKQFLDEFSNEYKGEDVFSENFKKLKAKVEEFKSYFAVNNCLPISLLSIVLGSGFLAMGFNVFIPLGIKAIRNSMQLNLIDSKIDIFIDELLKEKYAIMQEDKNLSSDDIRRLEVLKDYTQILLKFEDMPFLKYNISSMPFNLLTLAILLIPFDQVTEKLVVLFSSLGDTPFEKLCKSIDDAISKDDFKEIFRATKDACRYINHNNYQEFENHKKAKEILHKGIKIIQERFDKATTIADKAKNGKKISTDEMEYMKNMLNDIS